MTMKRALKCHLNLACELLIQFDSAKFSFSLKQLHHCSQAFFKHFTFFSIYCAYVVSFFSSFRSSCLQSHFTQS